jgi:hypothetical protein
MVALKTEIVFMSGKAKSYMQKLSGVSYVFGPEKLNEYNGNAAATNPLTENHNYDCRTDSNFMLGTLLGSSLDSIF